MTEADRTELMIGRYAIVSTLYRDSFSTVYRAMDNDLGRAVAIKVPPDEFGNDRLHEEAVVLSKLDHRSVQVVYDIGYHGCFRFIVSELTERSLDEEIHSAYSDGNRPTVSELSNWLECLAVVAEGLDYCHRRGYIHRCLSPRAIRFTRNGSPCLHHFELAISRESACEGEFVGIPAYMSPEQARTSPLITAASDIYSLGVILFEALTGERPRRGTALSLLSRVANGSEIRRPSKVWPDIPPQLEEVCLHCLRNDPSERYQSAAELAVELRRWNQGCQSSSLGQAFISHSSTDREFVEREIISLLERNGVRTWYSKVEIHSAKDWERTLRDGLENSDWLVFVMSKSSLQSEWCRDELFWAIDNFDKEKIVPVLIDDVRPEEFHIRLTRIQHVDFREAAAAFEAARHSLLHAFLDKS